MLFVCVHNSGRSQMAARFLHHAAGDLVEIRSAGSEPADSLNSTAVAAMTEVGIDSAGSRSALLAAEDVRASDAVITTGCGDACPVFPGTRYEDWALDDPAGQSLDAVRRIRDEIRSRVETLVTELAPAAEIAPESVLAPVPEPAGPASDGHRNTSTSNAEEAPHV